MVGASIPSALPGRIVEATPVGGVSRLVATPPPHARQRPAELEIGLPQREQTILLRAQKWSWSFALNWVETQIIASFARAGGHKPLGINETHRMVESGNATGRARRRLRALGFRRSARSELGSGVWELDFGLSPTISTWWARLEDAESIAIRQAVKLTPFYSALPHLAAQLDRLGAAGAGALQPILPAEHRHRAARRGAALQFSDQSELLPCLRWIAILSGRASLAASRLRQPRAVSRSPRVRTRNLSRDPRVGSAAGRAAPGIEF
jgi:hypothetical protein